GARGGEGAGQRTPRAPGRQGPFLDHGARVRSDADTGVPDDPALRPGGNHRADTAQGSVMAPLEPPTRRPPEAWAVTAPAVPQLPPEPARPFGKYVLVRKLAEGGMAEIFLAKHVGEQGFERNVVIKRMLQTLSAQADFVE